LSFNKLQRIFFAIFQAKTLRFQPDSIMIRHITPPRGTPPRHTTDATHHISMMYQIFGYKHEWRTKRLSKNNLDRLLTTSRQGEATG
jgi:hypothetical protein